MTHAASRRKGVTVRGRESLGRARLELVVTPSRATPSGRRAVGRGIGLGLVVVLACCTLSPPAHADANAQVIDAGILAKRSEPSGIQTRSGTRFDAVLWTVERNSKDTTYVRVRPRGGPWGSATALPFDGEDVRLVGVDDQGTVFALSYRAQRPAVNQSQLQVELATATPSGETYMSDLPPEFDSELSMAVAPDGQVAAAQCSVLGGQRSGSMRVATRDPGGAWRMISPPIEAATAACGTSALAFRSRGLDLLWVDASGRYLSRTSDPDTGWQPRVPISSAKPDTTIARTQLVSLADGGTRLAWIESAAAGRGRSVALRVATVATDGSVRDSTVSVPAGQLPDVDVFTSETGTRTYPSVLASANANGAVAFAWQVTTGGRHDGELRLATNDPAGVWRPLEAHATYGDRQLGRAAGVGAAASSAFSVSDEGAVTLGSVVNLNGSGVATIAGGRAPNGQWTAPRVLDIRHAWAARWTRQFEGRLALFPGQPLGDQAFAASVTGTSRTATRYEQIVGPTNLAQPPEALGMQLRAVPTTATQWARTGSISVRCKLALPGQCSILGVSLQRSDARRLGIALCRGSRGDAPLGSGGEARLNDAGTRVVTHRGFGYEGASQRYITGTPCYYPGYYLKRRLERRPTSVTLNVEVRGLAVGAPVETRTVPVRLAAVR